MFTCRGSRTPVSNSAQGKRREARSDLYTREVNNDAVRGR